MRSVNIVAINYYLKARLCVSCDLGIVGDMLKILRLLTVAIMDKLGG
jgi:electron transfer flavoprotein alpha subunit